MNLARHAAVLWRFRLITASGLIIGIVLAILASYKVSFDGGPNLAARGESTWNSTSSLLVTQPGFPEGRVVLPTTAQPTATDGTETVDPNRIEFADPGRFQALADLYAKLATSDRVRNLVPGKPEPDKIFAMPVPGQSGGPVLPMIEVTTTAASANGAAALNRGLTEALRKLLESEQADAKIPVAQRVVLSQLNAPSEPLLVSGPSKNGSILALLLCFIGTVAVTHLLASLRPLPGSRAEPVADGVVVPWTRNEDEAATAVAPSATVREAPKIPAGHWSSQ